MKEKLKIATILSNSMFKLSEKELELLAAIIKSKKISKGELVVKKGEVVEDIFWIGKGMLRQFYYKDGREITEHFSCEGQGALCITSLFKNEGSKLLVEALEDSQIFLIPYNKIIHLSEKHTSFAILLRKLLESSLIMSQDKADSWRYENVQERYERFLKEFPDAAKRASVNHIASYLLMTPETLSRVRARFL